jgi:molecular chaperone DnaK (HSP70)
VKRIILEPIAAVLSYNLAEKYKDSIEEKNAVVFDLGYCM